MRYLSDNYEVAARKELASDYPKFATDDPRVPLEIWYANNPRDIADFEKQMRRKVHYVIKPAHLWSSIANLAKSQSPDLLDTLRDGFKYIPLPQGSGRHGHHPAPRRALPRWCRGAHPQEATRRRPR